MKSTVKFYFSIPILLKYLYVPPYTSSQEITWSPDFRESKTQVRAAHPLEKLMQYLAYSQAAKASSKAVLVGLPHLE
jgi:hypothetical protein